MNREPNCCRTGFRCPIRTLLVASVSALLGCTPPSGGPAPETATPSIAGVRTQPADPDALLAQELDAIAPASLTASEVPSLAVAYIRDGRVRWTRVYGEQADGLPATTQTLYNVASLTKPISAEIILRLASTGRLSLDEPLSGHWIDPDVESDPRHGKLTLRLALSHQTGFGNWRYQTEGVLRFERDPGTQFGYSGEGYEYALRFTERKLGEPWESLAQESVLAPVGMTETAYTRQTWFADRMALPYGRSDDADTKAYLEPSIQASPSAADDVYTTIGDYAAFVVSVSRNDALSDEIATERASIQVAMPAATSDCDARRVTYCPVRAGMGLGWEILEFTDDKVLLHTGGDPGVQTMAFFFAGRRDGAVLFTNGDDGFGVMIPVIALLFAGTDLADFALSKR